MMQQTVLLTAVRGPDGIPKYHCVKYLLRWYRRCVLLSALDRCVWTTPWENGGGSFTGPSYTWGDHAFENPRNWEPIMDRQVDDYLREIDGLPHHFHMHLMHAAEILGFKHPDLCIKSWWYKLYVRLVHDAHLWPESEEQLDRRLGDTVEGWIERNDTATVG